MFKCVFYYCKYVFKYWKRMERGWGGRENNFRWDRCDYLEKGILFNFLEFLGYMIF